MFLAWIVYSTICPVYSLTGIHILLVQFEYNLTDSETLAGGWNGVLGESLEQSVGDEDYFAEEEVRGAGEEESGMLPPGWSLVTDPLSGQAYFQNISEGTSVWDLRDIPEF